MNKAQLKKFKSMLEARRDEIVIAKVLAAMTSAFVTATLSIASYIAAFSIIRLRRGDVARTMDARTFATNVAVASTSRRRLS